MKNLLISEVFKSLQGEGTQQGRPVIFIRTFGCNMGCSFCDSRFSWDNKESDKNKISMSSQEVIDAILATKGNTKHWVITGGEPLLQQEAFLELIELFSNTYGFLPEIDWETNGTITPIKRIDEITNIYAVSPKLSNALSGKKQETFNKRIKDEPIKFFNDSPKAFFKFVVGNEADLSEVNEIKDFFKIANNKIFLMPLGKTKMELTNRNVWLFNYCVNKHFNFSSRLQVELFGTRRKV